ncbi:MAG: Hsp70 family protein, partial [Myxococcales bacterium]|nr:Hsp70 family protein [Myxococcales bacterium]
MREAAIGIDLGTTNSVVAISSNGVPRVIAADGKHKINPSMVAFLNDGRILVGRRAKAVQQRLPERTIYNTKRLIGRFFGSEEVERVRTLVPFELMEGPRGDVHVAVGDRAFSATDISSILLNFLKKATERTLNEEIRKAVITVPAHFNDNQRHATQSAARMAGLEPIRILNEPTAAAIAYGLRKGMWKRVAVYDFGGGTFDISILDIAGDIFEVAATAGDTYLGGADIDRLIAQDFVDHVTKRYGVEVGAIPGFIHNLLPVAEQVKILLSENAEVVFNLEGIRIEGKTVDLQMELTQRRLAELSHELVQRSFLVCDDALRLAGLRADDIDEVVLTGGQTMMPVVQQAVAAYFRKAPRIGINPMEAVAIGAAVLAEQLTLPQRPAVQSFFGAGKGAGSTSGALGPAGDDDLELDV